MPAASSVTSLVTALTVRVVALPCLSRLSLTAVTSADPTAASAPLVYLTYTTTGGAAFVVTGDGGISEVPLPELTHAAVHRWCCGEDGVDVLVWLPWCVRGAVPVDAAATAAAATGRERVLLCASFRLGSVRLYRGVMQKRVMHRPWSYLRR